MARLIALFICPLIGQISVEHNSQTVAVTNTPTLNTFRIPGIQSTSGLTIISINNCTVNFTNYHVKVQHVMPTVYFFNEIVSIN
jgi:hypothetical protein